MKFSNRQTEQLPLNNLAIPQFLALAIEASKSLGWVFGDVNTTGFIAYTNNGLFSWNAEIKLKIKDDVAMLQSESRGDDVKDVRENKKNILNFISTFNCLKKSLGCEEAAPGYRKSKSNFSPN